MIKAVRDGSAEAYGLLPLRATDPEVRCAMTSATCGIRRPQVGVRDRRLLYHRATPRSGRMSEKVCDAGNARSVGRGCFINRTIDIFARIENPRARQPELTGTGRANKKAPQ